MDPYVSEMLAASGVRRLGDGWMAGWIDICTLRWTYEVR